MKVNIKKLKVKLAKTKDITGFDPIDTPAPPQGKNYLLAIAIDKYDEANNKIPRLSNCVKDATDLIQVLKGRFGFQEEQIYTVFDEEATLSNLNRELDALSTKVTEEDNVIVYYSGHGYYKTSHKEGFIIPVDGKKDAYWDYLSNANFLSHIRAINSFHTFVIIDSCFSGSLFATKDTGYTYSDRAVSFPSRWGLAAGMIEKVSDGFHGDNSPFAKAIISFLQNTSALKNPVSDLIQHVKKATANNAEQTPVGGPLFSVGDQNGEFVFEVTGKHAVGNIAREITQEDKPIHQTPKVEQDPPKIIPPKPVTPQVNTLNVAELKGLVASNKAKKALKAMADWLQGKQGLDDLQNQIILQQGRLSNLETQARMGVLSNSEQSLQRNRITMAVLSLIDELEDEMG